MWLRDSGCVGCDLSNRVWKDLKNSALKVTSGRLKTCKCFSN